MCLFNKFVSFCFEVEKLLCTICYVQLWMTWTWTDGRAGSLFYGFTLTAHFIQSVFWFFFCWKGKQILKTYFNVSDHVSNVEKIVHTNWWCYICAHWFQKTHNRQFSCLHFFREWPDFRITSFILFSSFLRVCICNVTGG